MAKIKVGEAEHEVPEEIKGAFDVMQAESAALKASLGTMVKKDELDKVTARADALEAQVKDLPKLAKARATLEREAAAFITAEKFDSMSDVEIKTEVVKKLLPAMKLDGFTEAQVAVAYTTAVIAAPAARGAANLGAFLGATQTVEKTDGKTAHERMVERQNNAWKTGTEKK